MKTIFSLLLMTVSVMADLNTWNDGTNSSIRVNGVLAQSITNTSLTASRAMVSGADLSETSSATTAAELAFVSGVTSAIQTQLNAKASTASVPTGANPTATIGSSAVNGSSTNFMRADAAPALGTVGTAGTYRSVTTDANGRVTAGTAPTTFSGYAISDSSANLAAALTDETGSGKAVFDTSPVINTSLVVTNGTLSVYGSGANASPLTIDCNTSSFASLTANRGLILAASSGNAVTIGGAGVGLSLSSGHYVVWNNDSFIYRGGAAATIELGADAASPVNQTFKACDGSGTDKAGANLIVEGGQSTGAGRGGNLVLRTATTSTAGSTANSYQERFHAVPKFVDLTDNTATTIFTVTLPTTNSIGMTFTCTVSASDGTDFQSLTTPVTIDAVAKSTTITAVVAPTAAQTALAASAGTLSVTYTVVDAGSNVLNVKVTAGTSLTPTYLRAKIVMIGINQSGVGVVITEI